jgi:WD40 repeat protein
VIVAVSDFVLDIGPGGDEGYRVRARSPDGSEVTATMRLRRVDLDALAARVPDAVIVSSAVVRGAAATHELPVRQLGGLLYRALFTEDVRGLLAATRDAVADDGRLRLVLRVELPELAWLPWEFLFDPDDDDYLCVVTPLIRHFSAPRPVPPLPVTPPLRVLAMAARPSDRGALAVDTEQDLLRSALAPLGEEAGRLQLGWVAGQTWRGLRDAVRDDGPWHVLHFIGHGGFDRQTQEGTLTLADDAGRAFSLRARDLASLLKNHRSLRLVVLNACDTGRAGALGPFSSVADTLLRAGIPAVLAMQYSITDAAAIEFSRTFYAEIARRRPVDVAVTDARQAIRIEIPGTLEWGTPVLYLHSLEGHIFDLTDPPASTARPPARAQDAPTSFGESTRQPTLLRSFEMSWSKAGCFSPDGTLFARYSSGHIRVMEVANGEERLSTCIDPEHERVGNVAFDGTGRRLATSGPDCACVWDATDGRRLLKLPRTSAWVRWVALSPDGARIATADTDGARIWDVATGAELLRLFYGDSRWVTFSPDGTRIASAGGNDCVVYDSVTGAECWRFTDTWDVAFSQDGTRIATAGHGLVRISRIADIGGYVSEPAEICRISSTTLVSAVAFSPYGTRIAAAGFDAVTRVWDLTSGTELHRITQGNVNVTHLEFSPDGSLLATATQDADRAHRKTFTWIWDLRGTS